MLETLDCLNKESILLLNKNRLLIPLIKAELIKNELSKILIDKEVEAETVSAFIKKLGIANEDDYKKWLINANMNDNELTNIAVQKLKLKKYCQNNFSNKIDSKFLERKSNLDIIIYSLIRVKDYFKARELYLRILDNEANFGDIAEKYSEGIESKTKGIVGPIELIKTHPQLIEILKSSKPGIINPPKLIEGFYLVTRLESYDSAKLDEFMREKMGEECFNDYIETESQELSQSILNKPLT